MSDNILTVPDEAGWYFFKKNKKSKLTVVYLNDDGVAQGIDQQGNFFELDDLLGRWLLLDSEEI
jgi:hypothetical protein